MQVRHSIFLCSFFIQGRAIWEAFFDFSGQTTHTLFLFPFLLPLSFPLSFPIPFPPPFLPIHAASLWHFSIDTITIWKQSFWMDTAYSLSTFSLCALYFSAVFFSVAPPGTRLSTFFCHPSSRCLFLSIEPRLVSIVSNCGGSVCWSQNCRVLFAFLGVA